MPGKPTVFRRDGVLPTAALAAKSAAGPQAAVSEHVFGEQGSASVGSKQHCHSGEQMHEQQDWLFHGETALGRFRSMATSLWPPKLRIRHVQAKEQRGSGKYGGGNGMPYAAARLSNLPNASGRPEVTTISVQLTAPT